MIMYSLGLVLYLHSNLFILILKKKYGMKPWPFYLHSNLFILILKILLEPLEGLNPIYILIYLY